MVWVIFIFDYYVDAFVNGEDWADVVKTYTEIDSITKDDVVRVANKYFGPSNYAAIYKYVGTDENIVKLPKPELTPIATNRDAASDFIREIAATEVEPIEPVFLDFKKDLTILKTKAGFPVYYTENKTNDISTLIYVIELGANDDKRLTLANSYFDLLGTPEMTADDLKREFYNLACSWNLSIGGDRSYILISGLSENLPRAAELFENFIANATVDTEAYGRLVEQIAQSRANNKQNQRVNFSRLINYVMYGPENPSTSVYSAEELASLDPAEIIQSVRDLYDYEQEVIYYGNLSESEIVALIDKIHPSPEVLKPVPAEDAFTQVNPTETVVFVAPYDATQLYMTMFANQGGEFDLALAPYVEMYNEYFGGGMNSIVFQEMRESRSLAYSAGAYELEPSLLGKPYTYRTSIATQNDKMLDAIDAFLLIINDMPQSQAAFDLAKQGLDARMRSARIIKDDIAWAYLAAKRLGLENEERETIFNALPALTLEDVINYQQNHVKGLTYYYGILGDPEDLDMEALSKIGRVVLLTTEDIFGY
ncbi:MAG: insulinase family protein [Muribaculaceae bacterium]|nr:insulinase family protein [Muribaculaceae bacterium]